jgi:hypothetical protein
MKMLAGLTVAIAGLLLVRATVVPAAGAGRLRLRGIGVVREGPVVTFADRLMEPVEAGVFVRAKAADDDTPVTPAVTE